MTHDSPHTDPRGRVIIDNVGLMLGGDLARPILDANAILVEGGVIRAVGRSGDMPAPASGDMVGHSEGSWQRCRQRRPPRPNAVSYTHLTLPTNREV